MKNNNKVLVLLVTLAAIFFVPYIGCYVKNGCIPNGFFHFPAIFPETNKQGNNLIVITITSILFIAFLLLIFYPKLYGFKKGQPVTSTIVTKEKFPLWFWIGLVLWLTILIVFAFKFSKPKWLLDWALLPLWWGFILVLDGFVYRRSNKRSLVSTAPTELVAMGILSISGWLIFEYYNFFTKLNWYYPSAGLLSHPEFLVYACLGSSAFIPMCFEWYQLFRTFPALNSKYKYGPPKKWSTSLRITLIIVSLAALYLVNYFPDNLFYSMWLAPLFILSIVTEWLGIDTPFTSIKNGDWTALLVFAPTFLVQGFCVESWNYLSAVHVGESAMTSNPGFWRYCIPFVSVEHVFEMPILGYLGYVPFSIYCFVWFRAISFIMDISNEFSFSEGYL